MKIAKYTSTSEKEALQTLLNNYHDTPHNATGVTPASMMFRDGQEGVFPITTVDSQKVQEARKGDERQKSIREQRINQHKFRVKEDILPGSTVFMRNHNKRFKFEPTFIPETFIVLNLDSDGTTLILKRKRDGAIFRRHPDDVKRFKGEIKERITAAIKSEREDLERWHKEWISYNPDDSGYFNDDNDDAAEGLQTQQLQQRQTFIRSTPYNLRIGFR